MNILCIEIWGVEYDHEMFAVETISENFYDEEPFTLIYSHTSYIVTKKFQ